MIKQLLHDLSFSIIRTNPKLTTNVKLMVDSNDKLYLESFSANSELSKSKFKGFTLNPSSSYDADLHKFYNNGKFPKKLAYEVFQGFDDTKILSKYSNQYEMFYNAGAEVITSQTYSESMGILSPLWLDKTLPNYFVIFKTSDPVSVNNRTVTTENENAAIVEDRENFIEHILAKSTIIKTIDLSEKSNIGRYIRNYFNKSSFPNSSISFTTEKNESTNWNGISYDKGGFVSKGEFSYQEVINTDKSIIENDYYFTKGFEKHGIISSNLINLEFLFDDETSDNYEINRYFGLYVNELSEGEFIIDGKKFYINAGLESSQIPLPSRIDSISIDSNDDFILNNDKGVLLYLDEVESITGLPDKSTVGELASVFYVKDKEENLNMIKTGSHWGENELRLSNTQYNLTNLKGFDKPLTFSTASILDEKGYSHCMFTVNSTDIPHGYSIEFLDSDISIGKIQCNQYFTEAGEANNRFFSNTGGIEEVVQSIKGAINNIENRMFIASVVDNKYIVVSALFAGSRFNKLNFKLDDNLIGSYIDYLPNDNEARNNFIGGTDAEYRIRVSKSDEQRFNTDRYIKTTTGFGKIKNIVLYLDNDIKNTKQETVGYNEINDYKVVIIENAKPYLDSLKQVSLYELYKPTFGRLSFFPIKDFDFDFFSEEYKNMTELDTEYEEYNKDDFSNGIIKSTNPDIKEFYKQGFSTLNGLLKEESSGDIHKTDIVNEYDRLKENYVLGLSNTSRVVPYINKWVYKDGKDVRNKDYRLNMSSAFGLYNFTPSADNYSPDPDSFTHEWYYLSKYPSYYVDEDLKDSYSYFDKQVYDNKEDLIGDGYTPGFFQDVENDNFLDYFVTDRFDYENKWIVTDKQIKYSTFDYGSENVFSETFFRGVKVRIKQRSDFNIDSDKKTTINYNLQKINYITDTRFNGYKFASIMIPHQNANPEQDKKPSFLIKFVENKKWKTITMIIFIDINYEYFDNGRQFIDRTLLYALKNNLLANEDGVFPENNYDYANTLMQGSLNFIYSSGIAPGPYEIVGGTNRSNVPTSFVQDIKLNSSGKYPRVLFEIDGPGGGQFVLDGITKVLNKSLLYSNYFTKDGHANISFPLTLPTPVFLREADYYVEDGGYLIYQDITRNVSFANINEKVNQGDPEVIYETISEDGTRTYNEFIIELQAANGLIKPTYINTIVDENRPVAFNLTDIIGYRFILSEKIQVGPYFRHSGKYDPKFIDVVKFEDPYLDIGNPEPTTYDIQLSEYQENVLENLRHTNSRMKLDDDFATVKNLYYHKVNEDNADSILELKSDGAFKSVYPLIYETGIDKRDLYLFKSNWDANYYKKEQSKTVKVDIVGTKNMKEHKSFFGSKIMVIPNSLTLDTYRIEDGENLTASEKENLINDIYYLENDTQVKLEINLEKKLTCYLHKEIEVLFGKYIKPEFSIGDKTSLEDDINDYIKTNILTRYKINNISLYVEKSKTDEETSYEYMEVDDYTKLQNGLDISNIFNTEFDINSNLNFSLIYNKITNYSYKFGLSIEIIKK